MLPYAIILFRTFGCFAGRFRFSYIFAATVNRQQPPDICSLFCYADDAAAAARRYYFDVFVDITLLSVIYTGHVYRHITPTH